jgi:arylsulfatase A-like enzyme
VNEAVREVLRDLPAVPLFLYAHYLDVHDWRHRDMSYREAVEEIDRGIGDLLAILDELGLLESAAVVLTSDHGELIDAEHVVKSLPSHAGNPSFRDVVDIPLVVVGALGVEIPDFARSEDLHHVLLALAGAPPTPSRDLAPNELLLTELAYRTYQNGRFKSLWRRGGRFRLLDLESDPGEMTDVAALHPEVADTHRRRAEELSHSLAAPSQRVLPTTPSEQWLDRLRALGYLE